MGHLSCDERIESRRKLCAMWSMLTEGSRVDLSAAFAEGRAGAKHHLHGAVGAGLGDVDVLAVAALIVLTHGLQLIRQV
jgi:hypothetical protein